MNKVLEDVQFTNQQQQKGILDEQENLLKRCHRALWTKPYSYSQRKNINPVALEGTCRWVFDHSDYVKWAANTENDLLWISADPGCGKSVLSRTLVDELSILKDQSLCYFFFKDNDEQHLLNTALCALLYQLFTQQPHLLIHAKKGFESYGSSLQHEVNILWDILVAAASDPNALQTTCILDALDEAADKAPNKSRQMLVQELCAFHTKFIARSDGTAKLKFLVMSRPYATVEHDFASIPSSIPVIRIRGEDENDAIHAEINLVIKQRVRELAEDKEIAISKATAEKLEQQLLKMKHRTYLWLQLAIDGVRATYRDSLHPDSEAIETLPESIEQAYETILRKANERMRGDVRNILLIVVGARRPLNIGELCLALDMIQQSHDAINKDKVEMNIRDWCGLFIFFNHGRIYLIHQTAKEFLLCSLKAQDSCTQTWSHCFSLSEADRTMATVCVRQICCEYADSIEEQLESTDSDARIEVGDTYQCEYANSIEGESESIDSDAKIEVGDTYQWSEAYPHLHEHMISLYKYSASNWISHVDASNLSVKDGLWSEIVELYGRITALKTWAWRCIMWLNWKLGGCARSPVFMAIVLGHTTVLDICIGTKAFMLEKRDEQHRTPLIFAAKCGSITSAKWLIDRKAELNARCRLKDDALTHALQRRHIDIVEALLVAGANPSSKGCRSHPLLRAAGEGFLGIVKLLLQKGCDVNVECGHYGTALQAAAYFGRREVVEFLLHAGADVNARTETIGTALQVALKAGYREIAKSLTNYGADVHALWEAKNFYELVCRKQDEHVLRLLVADIYARIF